MRGESSTMSKSWPRSTLPTCFPRSLTSKRTSTAPCEGQLAVGALGLVCGADGLGEVDAEGVSVAVEAGDSAEAGAVGSEGCVEGGGRVVGCGAGESEALDQPVAALSARALEGHHSGALSEGLLSQGWSPAGATKEPRRGRGFCEVRTVGCGGQMRGESSTMPKSWPRSTLPWMGQHHRREPASRSGCREGACCWGEGVVPPPNSLRRLGRVE